MANRTIDIWICYQIIKRLSTRFVDTDAYKKGLIDRNGELTKPRKEMTADEKKDVTTFDIMIFNLKKMLAKLPGGDSSLRNFAAALWLLKEDIDDGRDITQNDVAILAEEIDGCMDANDSLDESMRSFRDHVMTEEVAMTSGGSSDAPANSIGNGSIDNTEVKVSNIGKCRVYDVSSDTFVKCRDAKKKSDRFSRHIGTGMVSDDVREYARKNPGASIMIRDAKTGAHSFLKVGSKETF